MSREFPGSANLAVLLKWYGQALYDVTTALPRENSFSWDEIAMNEATRYQAAHRYYLLPISEPGEKLKNTYARLREQQIYPILMVPKVLSREEQKFKLSTEDGFTDHDFNCYFLNEFYFQENKLCASSSIFHTYHYPSRVTIPTPHVLDAFSRYFCLIQFTDTGLAIKKPAQNYITIN